MNKQKEGCKMVDQSKFTGNFVSTERIESVLEESEFLVYHKVYGNTTIVVAKLPNGFTIVESTGCVNPDNYNEEIGEKICLDKIKKKIWELEGYALQDRIYKTKLEEPVAKVDSEIDQSLANAEENEDE